MKNTTSSQNALLFPIPFPCCLLACCRSLLRSEFFRDFGYRLRTAPSTERAESCACAIHRRSHYLILNFFRAQSLSILAVCTPEIHNHAYLHSVRGSGRLDVLPLSRLLLFARMPDHRLAAPQERLHSNAVSFALAWFLQMQKVRFVTFYSFFSPAPWCP